MGKKIKIDSEERRNEAISYLRIVDLTKNFWCEIKRVYAKRSLSQNNLMWLWITVIATETENKKELVYDALIQEYAPDEKIMLGNKEKTVKKTSSRFNTKEETDFLNAIHLEGSELGINLPNPEDKHFQDFCEYYSKFL